MANGTVRGLQKTGFAFGWKAISMQLKIFKATQFWLEEVRKFTAELLAGLLQCVIGLAVFQDGSTSSLQV